MLEQLIVVYTMDGCPYCVMMKDELDKLNIPFVCRDINEEEEEYELFVKAVEGNDYVPAFMTIETDGEKYKTNFYAPERDFDEISEGVKIIKEFYDRFN